MIEPLHSLAFSIQANPGVYAVLIGSGVSRSAQIPTGWEITLDFVRKLAEMENENCGSDPALWYRTRNGEEPNYSDLLNALAKTPAERQQLLRTYLEPSETERADGLKAPTAAHRSIASLAAKGYIRIIITTNFDRLMEAALADVDVVPTVLSSPDQVRGAMPLIHTRCCVFKVHGDYLDPRIRNTTAELGSYPEELNDLLDRILDEFGLIVCGWSAEWDTALRAAVERAASRRFSHFWAVRGEPGNAAKQLIEHRQGQKLLIEDADSFFSELGRLVEALEQFSRPHPLSTEAAVASLKGYLADPKHRIRLADLVSGEVDRVLDAMATPAFALRGGPAPDAKTFTARVRAYEATCETLVAMAAVGGYWVEDWHYTAWQTALTKLATRRGEPGLDLWGESRRYPATLLLYALGLGAVEAGERGLLFLGKLFGIIVHREYREEQTAIELLPPFWLFRHVNELGKLLEGMDRRRAPLNDWIHALLQPRFRSLIPSEFKLTDAFDKLEVLMALGFAHHAKRPEGHPYLVPPGCYGYRRDSLDRIVKEMKSSIESLGDNSPYVRSGIFGHSAKECIAAVNALTDWVPELGWF
ncbi:SIR2 family protein [Comamonadaceae bacterium M7527]|nr:SIR2 family protein [Comamonadaceae bacterium M7527]